MSLVTVMQVGQAFQRWIQTPDLIDTLALIRKGMIEGERNFEQLFGFGPSAEDFSHMLCHDLQHHINNVFIHTFECKKNYNIMGHIYTDEDGDLELLLVFSIKD
jgi:hypothetical protein